MSIRNQAVKGMMWNAIERFSTQGILFLLTIVLARFLSPDDYGLVAMLSIFLIIAQVLVDGGFGNALIQNKNRNETDYSTVFFFNLLFSVFLYLLLFFAAPLIADFYNQPALVEVTRWLGLILIINSLSVVQQAHFTIQLDFKHLALASLIGVVVSGSIALVMAYLSYGVWALVVQTLVSDSVRALVLWKFSSWKPRWLFSRSSFKMLFSFGGKLMSASVIHTLYQNLYSLVVGKFYPVADLGYFNRAYTISQFPTNNITMIMVRVFYPVLCKFQDDEEKLKSVFRNYMRMSCFVMFPIMIAIAVLAEPLVRLLLTEKWMPIVPLLQIVCLAGMLLPVMQINVAVLDAKGRSDYHLRSEIIKKVFAVIFLFASLPLGLEYVCWGMLLYNLVDIVIVIKFVCRVVPIGYGEQLKMLLSIMALGATMGVVAWLSTCHISDDWLRLLVGVAVCGVWYLGGAWMCHFPEFMTLRLIRKDHENSLL